MPEEKQKPLTEKPKSEDLQLLEEQRRRRFLDFVTSEGKAPKPDVKEPERKTKPARHGLSLGQKLLIGAGIGLAVATGAGVARGDTIYLNSYSESTRAIENVVVTKVDEDEILGKISFYIPGLEFRPLEVNRRDVLRIERNPNIVSPFTREEAEKRYADAKSKIIETRNEQEKSAFLTLVSIFGSIIAIGVLIGFYGWIISPEGVVSMGDLFARIGDRNRAKNLWSKVTDKFVKDKNWLKVVSIGDRFERIGDKEKAKQLWSIAVEELSKSDSSLDLSTAIRSYKKLGRTDKVRELEPRYQAALQRGELEEEMESALSGIGSWFYSPEEVRGIGDGFERVGDIGNAKKCWLNVADMFVSRAIHDVHDFREKWSGVESIGDRLARIGDMDNAKKLWLRAAEEILEHEDSDSLSFAIRLYKKLGYGTQGLESRLQEALEFEHDIEILGYDRAMQKRGFSRCPECGSYHSGECWKPCFTGFE